MLDNCTQYFHFELFDHIRWHVIAKSAIQEILNLRPNAKKMPEKENLVDFSARFLKTMHIFLLVCHFNFTKVRRCQTEICLTIYLFSLHPFLWVTPMSYSSDSCPLNQHFWLHIFLHWHRAAVVFSCFYIQWWMSLAFVEFHQSSLAISSVWECHFLHVIVGVRTNVVCLHLISALTN